MATSLGHRPSAMKDVGLDHNTEEGLSFSATSAQLGDHFAFDVGPQKPGAEMPAWLQWGPGAVNGSHGGHSPNSNEALKLFLEQEPGAADFLAAGGGAKGYRHSSSYRTRLCRYHAVTGGCPFGSKCCFAHGEEELRTPPSSVRHPLANNGICDTNGAEHNCEVGLGHEPHVQMGVARTLPKYKTKLCTRYASVGGCALGDSCQFAHGLEELRNAPGPKYPAPGAPVGASGAPPPGFPVPQMLDGHHNHHPSMSLDSSAFQPLTASGLSGVTNRPLSAGNSAQQHQNLGAIVGEHPHYLSVRTRSERAKIFVGGLPHWVDDEAFKNFFEQEYGEVKSATVMCNHETGQSRGFGFITFVHDHSAMEALKRQFLPLDGKRIEVRLAVPRSELPPPQHQQSPHQPPSPYAFRPHMLGMGNNSSSNAHMPPPRGFGPPLRGSVDEYDVDLSATFGARAHLHAAQHHPHRPGRYSMDDVGYVEEAVAHSRFGRYKIGPFSGAQMHEPHSLHARAHNKLSNSHTHNMYERDDGGLSDLLSQMQPYDKPSTFGNGGHIVGERLSKLPSPVFNRTIGGMSNGVHGVASRISEDSALAQLSAADAMSLWAPPRPPAQPVREQPLTGEQSAAMRRRSCLVCWERVAERVAVPCGHRAVCKTCADSLQPKSPVDRVSTTGVECPFCHIPVLQWIAVYEVV
eukprot:jgi/Chlat1/6191/Chrsp42S05733